jgi:hypothetical protein
MLTNVGIDWQLLILLRGVGDTLCFFCVPTVLGSVMLCGAPENTLILSLGLFYIYGVP